VAVAEAATPVVVAEAHAWAAEGEAFEAAAVAAESAAEAVVAWFVVVVE